MLSTYDRVKELTESHSMTLAELERKVDIGNGVIARWKKQNPNVESLQKIADYFDVSVDYLLGRTENPMPRSTPEEDFSGDPQAQKEIRLIQRKAQLMTPEQREMAIDLWEAAFKELFKEDEK